jgi:5-formyltetrahydrofolate cyclo-ligase
MGQHKRVAHAGKISGMDDIALTKAQLRREILAGRKLRENLDSDQLNLTQQLLALVARTKPARVATYISFGSEPSTAQFIAELLKQNICVLVPKVNKDDLSWFEFDGESIASSTLGMGEPDSMVLKESTLADTDLLVIPALAIDRLGNRLGRGKGYFDRTLASTSNGHVVAICFESEFVRELPVESHDRRVNLLVTEVATYDLN